MKKGDILFHVKQKAQDKKERPVKKILFLIHDLGQGGAEKVLVNLVNNMDQSKFDITLMALFGGGVNEQFLSPKVRYRTIFKKNIPGNSRLMKLLSPELLHRAFVHEHYDVEISYLEGPSARIVSGCRDARTKLISWIHVEQHTMELLAKAFRNEEEARRCYARFDQTICVSEYVKDDFCRILGFQQPCRVLYNTVESEKIKELAAEPIDHPDTVDGIRLIGVGTLKPVKGFDRLIRIHQRLQEEGYAVSTSILGRGPEKDNLLQLAKELKVSDSVTFLGYQTNPYKYVARADLFVCCSFAEGFSTAATESLIVGTPVCTVEVSGMKEMLGANDEYGVVVENRDEALYQAIKGFVEDPQRLKEYKQRAEYRGKDFSTAETVQAVESMLLGLSEE